MMKHKVCRVLIYTSNFFSTRNNLLSSKVASYTFFTWHFFHFCCLRFSAQSKEKGIPQGKEDNKDGDDKEEDKKNTPLANCDDAKGKQLRKDDHQEDEGHCGPNKGKDETNNSGKQAASNIGDESGNASQRLTPQNSKGTADTKVSGKCSDDHLEPREENTLSIREEMEALGLLDDTISGHATAKQMFFLNR